MHWNLFIVLESDLAEVSKYIEFDERNFEAFSTQLSKLLLSIGSEVDVVLKQLCRTADAKASRKNIIDYFKVINSNASAKEMLNEEVFITRFGLSFQPFAGWDENNRPKWWRAYNNVKHDRLQNYPEASLKNVLFAISALMICIFYLEKLSNPEKNNKKITSALQPSTLLLKLQEDYYYDTVVV
ncbi:TPA: hypothetical protein I7230_18170 [Vibrio vulnificus]|nr:hypothetical protein [Vibrio vulnificus]HAS6127226.1 hypothetical protein [Vibrio vulnificus]HAS6282627.1 hypothetical protein [Vibrio vulnificus]HAS6363457.1 hypothetical protein [Vibrio vulnificus]HAS6398896.1 hypothetical protein [Vibrio vulnificus]